MAAGAIPMPGRPARAAFPWIVKGEAGMDLGAVFAAEVSRPPQPLVVCDVDNVLAWHAEAVCIALNARFGTSYLVTQMTAYPLATMLEAEQAAWLAQYTERGSWCANLAPDHEAIAAMAAIRGTGHRVTISSDRPAQVADATTAWLDYWQVQRDGDLLQGPGSKQAALAASAAPAVLVDDDPRKWLTVARPGVGVWCPARPWTPQGWRKYPNVRVFQSWAEPLSWLGAVTSV
jgi:hypothetical protein